MLIVITYISLLFEKLCMFNRTMSGAEFIAVAGVISSIIAIAHGIKQVVDAVSQADGLPKAFRQASNQLPLVNDILEATVRNFRKDDVSWPRCFRDPRN
jgi:hypothetical protein